MKKAQMSFGWKIFIGLVLTIFLIIVGLYVYRNVISPILGGG
jgi:hypothetical protein